MKHSEALRPTPAHHDGSLLYVSNPNPGLNDHVELLIRTAADAGIRRVHVRTVPDGEPQYREAVVDHKTVDETWWRVSIKMWNKECNYRFLLITDDRPLWLTAAGMFKHDVPDSTDFTLSVFTPPPAWSDDAVIYQVFLDRFANSGRMSDLPSWAQATEWNAPIPAGTPEAMNQIYGGDLWGVAEKLGHIEDLGANVIYLTPFFPSRSNHRYDATTFEHVDPLLGGDEALLHLTTAAHARGIRVIGDITLNHSGSGHEWFRKAQEDPSSAEADFYYFDRANNTYATFLGVESLPKFDHRSPELRRRLYEGPESVIARYINELGLDGWRVDVAQSAGVYGAVDLTDQMARLTKATMGPDHLLIAEHGFDASSSLRGTGWDGTMAYAGFTRPIWAWLAGEKIENFWGAPGPIPSYGGEDVVDVMRSFSAQIPWRAYTHNLSLLDSHDTARIRSIAGRDHHHLAVALMLTLPGLPMIFSGDEVGVEGFNMEDSRRPFPWDEENWDHSTFNHYRDLLTLRKTYPSLRTGGLRWLHSSKEALVFERSLPGETILIQVNRSSAPTLTSAVSGKSLAGGPDLKPGELLPSDGPQFHIWEVTAETP